MSAVRPLVPESWGQVLFDQRWHYFAFEQLNNAGEADGYVALCRERIFVDEVVLSAERDSDGSEGTCQPCLDELLSRASTLAGVVGGELAGGDPPRPN